MDFYFYMLFLILFQSYCLLTTSFEVKQKSKDGVIEITNYAASKIVKRIYGCNTTVNSHHSLDGNTSFITFSVGYGNYFYGSMVTLYSLLKTCPKFPVSVMLANVTNHQAKLFLKIGVSSIFIIPTVDWKLVSLSTHVSYRWKTWTKFQLWRLTSYKELLFIDSDSLVLQNIDEVIEKTNTGDFSVCSHISRGEFNSGVMKLSTNESLFYDLSSISRTVSKYIYLETEQDILEALFSKKKRLFDCTMYNNYWFSWNPLESEDSVTNNSKVLHWAGSVKPWKQCNTSDETYWATRIWCKNHEEMKVIANMKKSTTT